MSCRSDRVATFATLLAAMAAGIMLPASAHATEAVNAGPVKIIAVNQSHDLVHEVIVIRQKDSAPLPYNPRAQRVIEEQVDDLGEVADLDPGKSGSLTVNLSPGRYLLACNQPGHYKAGMWTRLTVIPAK